nr:MAG TPA: hypothetical protein [Caudoviricetes sp.]
MFAKAPISNHPKIVTTIMEQKTRIITAKKSMFVPSNPFIPE